MKYWHEIPQSEIDNLIKKNVQMQFVYDNYKQPDWCKYSNALDPLLGCWSLTGNNRTKISKKFCKTCECYSSTD